MVVDILVAERDADDALAEQRRQRMDDRVRIAPAAISNRRLIAADANTKNRDRLLDSDVATKFVEALLRHTKVKRFLSDDHISVDGFGRRRIAMPFTRAQGPAPEAFTISCIVGGLANFRYITKTGCVLPPGAKTNSKLASLLDHSVEAGQTHGAPRCAPEIRIGQTRDFIERGQQYAVAAGGTAPSLLGQSFA